MITCDCSILYIYKFQMAMKCSLQKGGTTKIFDKWWSWISNKSKQEVCAMIDHEYILVTWSPKSSIRKKHCV